MFTLVSRPRKIAALVSEYDRVNTLQMNIDIPGSFLAVIKGKTIRQIQRERDANLQREISNLQQIILAYDTCLRTHAAAHPEEPKRINHIVEVNEGSLSARLWLENEGFVVKRTEQRYKGCGASVRSRCHCTACEQYGLPNGVITWEIKWSEE